MKRYGIQCVVGMSAKRDIQYTRALEIAEDFLAKTKDLYRKAEIAGSLRRKEPVVHDIDFAVIPSIEDMSVWKEKVEEKSKKIGATPKSFGETICDLIYKDTQINLFICKSEDTWGVVLMWATGPKGHTIGMTIKAQKKGLIYSMKGIFTREDPQKLIPTRTEEDVARILDWKYKPPETRGKNTTHS